MDKKRFITLLAVGVVLIVAFSMFSKGGSDKKVASEGSEITVQEEPKVELAPADYDMQQQLDFYTNKISQDANDVGNYYQRALVYQKHEQYRLAIDDYTRVLNINPQIANALANRAACYTAEGMREQAINDYEAALKIKSNDASIYNSLALLQVDANDVDAAIANYKKSIEINPNFDQAYFNLGTAYERQGNVAAALEAYTGAIEHNTAGVDTEEAKADAKQRLASAYLRRAIVQLDQTQFDAALSDANSSIELDSKNPKAFRVRAQIYENLGNTTAAASDNSTAENLGLENLMDKQ